LDLSSNNESNNSEVELYVVDVLPQVVDYSMQHLKDIEVVPSKKEEILSKVKFGPTLTSLEGVELEALVSEFSDLFICRHCNLPAIISSGRT